MPERRQAGRRGRDLGHRVKKGGGGVGTFHICMIINVVHFGVIIRIGEGRRSEVPGERGVSAPTLREEHSEG